MDSVKKKKKEFYVYVCPWKLTFDATLFGEFHLNVHFSFMVVFYKNIPSSLAIFMSVKVGFASLTTNSGNLVI